MTHAPKPLAACCGAPQSTGKFAFPYSGLDLEGGARDPALPNDGLQRSDPKLRVIGNWNCDGTEVRSPLHHDVAPALTDDLKIVLFKDAADVSPRKDAEFTHGPLRSG